MEDGHRANSSGKKSAGLRIREERELRGWSQQYVAEQLGADRYYLSRWENGKMLPSPYYREKLCALFGKNARELGFLEGETPQQVASSEAPMTGTNRAATGIFDASIPSQPDAAYVLVGRQNQLATLKARLCSSTPSLVVALYGLPGVGKTALAVNLAHDREIQAHFRDGILWAGAGKEPNSIGILSRWGTLLGIASVEAANLTTQEAWAQAIRASIGSRQMLLIIDDIWTLEAFLAFKVGGHSCVYLLTTRFPQLAWQATVNGAFPVAELNTADSLLLLERLAAPVVQREAALAEELVHLVGGLPLALLLAGNFLRAQAYTGQPRRIRQSIEQLRAVEVRLHLQEPQAFVERSPSLVNTPVVSLHTLIAVSDQQLHMDARAALYALAVFPAKPNTFSEEAALAVCQCSTEVLDVLSDAGLVESYAPDCYTLHQTIADYARLQSIDAAPVGRFVRFIADYLRSHKEDYPLLERESANILAALHLAWEHDYRAELVAGGNIFAAFLSLRGFYVESVDLLERICEAATAIQDAQGLTTALCARGEIAINRGEYELAYDLLCKGLSLTSNAQPTTLRGRLLRGLGNVECGRGEYALAQAHLQEAADLARQLRDFELLSLVLRSLSANASDQGKFVEAEAYVQEGLTIARQLEKPDLICSLLSNLDQIILVRGQYARAEIVIREALEIAQQIGFRSAICVLLQHLGFAAMEQKKYAEAREPMEQSLMLARETDDRENIVAGLANLGQLFIRQGDTRRAEPYLQEGLALARTLQNPWIRASMLDEWGGLCLLQGRVDEAAAAFDEVFQLSNQGIGEYEALALYGQARVAHARDNRAEARRLGQESLVRLQAMDYYRTAEVAQWLQESGK